MVGVFLCKKWKMGGSVKSGPFLNARYAMYSISILYFTFYSYGGGAYVPNAPPLPTGLTVTVMTFI